MQYDILMTLPFPMRMQRGAARAVDRRCAASLLPSLSKWKGAVESTVTRDIFYFPKSIAISIASDIYIIQDIVSYSWI